MLPLGHGKTWKWEGKCSFPHLPPVSASLPVTFILFMDRASPTHQETLPAKVPGSAIPQLLQPKQAPRSQNLFGKKEKRGGKWIPEKHTSRSVSCGQGARVREGHGNTFVNWKRHSSWNRLHAFPTTMDLPLLFSPHNHHMQSPTHSPRPS